ncbi:hypothetical protein [Pseudochryseolinea flava]|uniref:Uncharacterized protein n=1 Tax=Pseudochryseolinea flava TaxID=2059302 RepID=A0A364Y570_9BACT|nr:hypothetical protein [Pseudochryseolinea flava]RAW02009.1 hypothetical protein DQQ10_05490 [Pseudochryseolinea flava]
MNALSRYFEDNKPSDFHPADFPEVVAEVADLRARLENILQPDNDIVIISYVRHHAIGCDLAKSHAALIKILNTKGSCAHLENVFVACGTNTQFRNSLENYVKSEINVYYKYSPPSRYPNGDLRIDDSISAP